MSSLVEVMKLITDYNNWIQTGYVIYLLYRQRIFFSSEIYNKFLLRSFYTGVLLEKVVDRSKRCSVV